MFFYAFASQSYLLELGWGIFLPRVRFFLVSHSPLSIRNSLPFTSLRPVTVGSGRDFLEGDTRRGQAQGLLERWLDPVPAVAVAEAHDDATIPVEEQAVRADTGPRDST